jgi:hypothetical protein
VVRRVDFDDDGPDFEPSRLRAVLLPLGLLVVVIAVISALVLSGVLQGDPKKRPPVAPATTAPTVEIAP